MSGLQILWIILGVLLFFIIIRWGIRIVREYQRLVIFRLGKCIGAKGPGIVFLIPFIDIPVRVDLREQYLEIPNQICITKDNAPISIDFLIYAKVVEPVLSVIKVQTFLGAVQGLATTTLRAVVGDIVLDDVLAKREEINEILAAKLDQVTAGWGVKVTRVELREIAPPKEVSEAMIKQMSAERQRRATVTEAEGKKAAAIAVAEGEKQAAILKAEGERQARILVAEGFSLALEKIFAVAKEVDNKTMTLQYFEALKALGASPSTKYIFPMEFTNLLKPIIGNIQGAVSESPPPEGK
ncbi:MAG: SPFH/Band 7/PHB domain protein [Caldiserica bacterium]|nr:SPFH/Band 7/PHB domain protein [Caldisericota bacterium]MDH7563025.1 SPFH domain-containing protein [Caldisericota bacterium]